jgi:lysophospholipase L1-like esterase
MFQRLRMAALAVAVLLVPVLTFASPAAGAKGDLNPGQPVMLALGDSWAFGFGASVPSETGYVPLVYHGLQEGFNCSPSERQREKGGNKGCKHLQLLNIAVGGATTPTLIAGQLPEATALLEDRNGDRNPRNNVEVITISIGGNDVTTPILTACLSGPGPGCIQTIQTEFAAYRSDLDTALSRLREAAGPDARIVLNTYDNPIPTCFVNAFPGASFLAGIVLEGGPGVPQGLHDIMREVAADYGVEIAEVFGDLAPQDWLGGQDCLHPRDSGYAKVAQAFLEVLVG